MEAVEFEVDVLRDSRVVTVAWDGSEFAGDREAADYLMVLKGLIKGTAAFGDDFEVLAFIEMYFRELASAPRGRLSGQ